MEGGVEGRVEGRVEDRVGPARAGDQLVIHHGPLQRVGWLYAPFEEVAKVFVPIPNVAVAFDTTLDGQPMLLYNPFECDAPQCRTWNVISPTEDALKRLKGLFPTARVTKLRTPEAWSAW